MKRCCLLIVTISALLQPPYKEASAQSTSTSAKSFVAVRDGWIESWKSGNLNRLCNLYAKNAVFLPALGSEIQGRDAICDYLEQIHERLSIGASFVESDGADGSSADVAYVSGAIVYWIKNTAAPIKGSYLMVFRRESNGNWQIVRQAFAGLAVRYESNPK